MDPGETRCGAERGGSNFAIAVRFGALNQARFRASYWRKRFNQNQKGSRHYGRVHGAASNSNPLPKEIVLLKADGLNPSMVCNTHHHQKRAQAWDSLPE